MRSVRLEPALDDRIKQAAAVRGESVSEFLRQAAVERADATLTARKRDLFADVIGVVHSNGGRAERTGVAFAEGLVADRKRTDSH